MGKHSAPESPGFWRAVIIAGFRYLLIVAALAAVAFGVYSFVTADDPAAQDQEGSEGSVASPAPPSPSPSQLLGQGEEVQILNGTTSAEKYTQVAEKLSTNGYAVRPEGTAARAYETTTVLFQPDSQALGQTVASLLGADVLTEATEDLDPSIPVTVVIGEDYSG